MPLPRILRVIVSADAHRLRSVLVRDRKDSVLEQQVREADFLGNFEKSGTSCGIYAPGTIKSARSHQPLPKPIPGKAVNGGTPSPITNAKSL
jgi:hypothetical protein